MLRRAPLLALLLTACPREGAPVPPPPPVAGPRVGTVAQGLAHPWSLAFLPDGRFLVTERPGRLRVVSPDGGVSAPVAGLPPVDAVGQGGLLDVALPPDFGATREVFWTFVEPGPEGTNGTALARGRLADDARALTDVRVLWRQTPKLPGGHHFGSRLAFARDGRLFVTTGERNQRELAQRLSHAQGKVVRLERDGGVPADNPFVGTAGALPEVWSYGHRNLQGAALHPVTAELWTHEHGPRGGDEVNVARAGRNYGWPRVSFGREYSGQAIAGGATAAPGLEPPLHTWVPSIAPSGMAFVTTARYPGWQGSLLVGGLAGQVLVRLVLDGERVVREERLLTSLRERLRDVREAPDGAIYLLTDSSKGKLLKLEGL